MTFIKHIKQSVQNLDAYTVKSLPLSPDVIKLNQNENPFDLPDDLKRELLESFRMQSWNRYPGVFPAELTAALSRYTGMPADSIIVANGSNELMYTIMMAIVGRGTRVLIPAPTFFLYEKIVTVMEGEVVSVPAHDDLSFDVDAIIAAAKKNLVSLIVLNSPNSPTGQMLEVKDVRRIIDETDAIVLVDEAYIEFADRPSVLPLLATYDRLIILRTFSKAFSLAGLRIGYLMAQPALCAELLKPKIPFTVNNFSASMAIAVMERRALIDERIALIKTEKQRLYEALQQIRRLKVFPSQTNFLIFTPPGDAQSLFNSLLADHVLIRDVGSYPMLKNTLRVNAGTDRENRAFLQAIRRHLQ